nr:O-fucosyltransferase 37 [Ipomoea batatas]
MNVSAAAVSRRAQQGRWHIRKWREARRRERQGEQTGGLRLRKGSCSEQVKPLVVGHSTWDSAIIDHSCCCDSNKDFLSVPKPDSKNKASLWIKYLAVDAAENKNFGIFQDPQSWSEQEFGQSYLAARVGYIWSTVDLAIEACEHSSKKRPSSLNSRALLPSSQSSKELEFRERASSMTGGSSSGLFSEEVESTQCLKRPKRRSTSLPSPSPPSSSSSVRRFPRNLHPHCPTSYGGNSIFLLRNFVPGGPRGFGSFPFAISDERRPPRCAAPAGRGSRRRERLPGEREEFWQQAGRRSVPPLPAFSATSTEKRRPALAREKRRFLVVVVSGGLNQAAGIRSWMRVVIARIRRASLVVPVSFKAPAYGEDEKAPISGFLAIADCLEEWWVEGPYMPSISGWEKDVWIRSGMPGWFRRREKGLAGLCPLNASGNGQRGNLSQDLIAGDRACYGISCAESGCGTPLPHPYSSFSFFGLSISAVPVPFKTCAFSAPVLFCSSSLFAPSVSSFGVLQDASPFVLTSWTAVLYPTSMTSICISSKRNGVALMRALQSGLEGLKADELRNFSNRVKILDGIPDRLVFLPDWSSIAVGVEQTVRRRLVQQ